MRLLTEIPPDKLTPARLWSELDPGVRELAARALLASPAGSRTMRQEANRGIAATLRFREVAVQKLSVDRRVGYLVRAVRPDDSLAASLLAALHLGERRELLATFLDALEIPHTAGAIADDHDLQTPSPESLAGAVDALQSRFAQDDVELYLATLVAIDPEIWSGLADVVRDRQAG